MSFPFLIIVARRPTGSPDRIVREIRAADKAAAIAERDRLEAGKLIPAGCSVVSRLEFDMLNTPVKARPNVGRHPRRQGLR